VSGRTSWQRIARRIRVPLGFVFAAAFLCMAHPTWSALTVSLALVGPGLWLRAYASGYVRKDAELTTTGPYAYTRNPLYLGSMLIAFGFAAASARWQIVVVLAVLFAAIYIPTILSEEAYLRTNFSGFDEYARRVPRLLPRLGAAAGEAAGAGLVATIGASSEQGRFSRELYLRHREYNSAMGAGAIYLALVVLRLFVLR